MNARIAISLTLLSLVLAACGNKGPLVQAPVEAPVIEMPAEDPAPGPSDEDGLPVEDEPIPEEGDGPMGS